MSSWVSTKSCELEPILNIEPGQSLHSSSSHYTVLEVCGEGHFGKVARCQNVATGETVAVKVFKKTGCIEREVSMLEAISVLDVDKANVLKFLEQFEDQGLTCLVFEMLDRSLKDWLKERESTPLFLESMRPIAKQLLVALDALKAIDVLHTDIKPDNIMLVNMQDQPLRVKLIDFGVARLTTNISTGCTVQPLGYRAPEVVLGLPLTTAIDVWGVGCILAFLYLGEHPFPLSSEYEMMKAIVHFVGQPEDHLLRAGRFSHYLFVEEEAADGPTWRLLTQEEYDAFNLMVTEDENDTIDQPSTLEGLVHIYEKEDDAEFEDRLVFVDLLKQLLHVDPDQRISPREALQHPFITMEHLKKIPDSGAYLATSQASMSEPWNLDGDVAPVSHHECPDVCSTDGAHVEDRHGDEAAAGPSDGDLAVSHHECLDVCSTDGAQDEDIHGDEAAAGPSDGEVHRWSDDDILAAKSSEGAEPPGLAPDVSASSSRPRKFLRRIRKFFKWIKTPFSCCLHPKVED